MDKKKEDPKVEEKKAESKDKVEEKPEEPINDKFYGKLFQSINYNI